MGCRRKNTLCLSLDFGANDGTLLPRLTRLETSPSPQKRLVLKFPNNFSAISTIAPSKTALFGCLVHGRLKNGLATRPKGKISHSHGGPR